LEKQMQLKYLVQPYWENYWKSIRTPKFDRYC